MFWEEKIDLLKKDFSSADFSVPYTDSADIMQKLEAKFIIKENSSYHFANWLENLKSKTLIRTILREEVRAEFKKLSSEVNYWLVIQLNNSPTGKFMLYDCKINAMEKLLSIAPADFCIADKKYNWFVYFSITEAWIKIFKSRDTITPFDIAG